MAKQKHIVPRILAGVLLLLALALIAIQLPYVQTAVASKALDSLKDSIDGEVNVGKISLKPFNTLIIKDLVITDDSPLDTIRFAKQDTLARIGTTVATFSLKGLTSDNGIKLNKVLAEDATINLVIEGKRKNNIKRIFRLEPKDKDPEEGEILSIKKVSAKNLRFRMLSVLTPDHSDPEYDGCIDWGDLDVVANVSGRDLRMVDGRLYASVDDLDFVEKSGFRVREMSANTAVGRGRADVTDIRIFDGISNIDVDRFSMLYTNVRSFRTFTDSIRIEGRLGASDIDFKTLSYFVPALKNVGMNTKVHSGSIDGTCNDFRVEKLSFTDKSGVQATADLSYKNEGKKINASLHPLSFRSSMISPFIKELGLDVDFDPEKYISDESFVLECNASGTPERLNVNAVANIGDGLLKTVMTLNDLTSGNKPTEVKGHFETSDLDLGKLLDKDFLGKCDLSSKMAVSFGAGSGASATLDSLRVSRIGVLGYDYSRIAGAGTFKDNAFDGKIISSDPNLNFLFQGHLNLSEKVRNALYKFYFNVGYADLNALKLDKRKPSKASFAFNANYMRVQKLDLIGNIDIRDIELESSTGVHNIGNVSISSHSNDDINRIVLSSSFANGSYIGTKPVTSFIDGLLDATARKYVPVLFDNTYPKWKGDEYNIALTFHDSRDLLSFIKPGLYIADGTYLSLGIDKNGEMSGNLKSQRLALGGNYVKDLIMDADNANGSLSGVILGDEIKAGAVTLPDNRISLYASDNNIGASISFNQAGTDSDKGELILIGKVDKGPDGKPLIKASTRTSAIYHDSSMWQIDSSNFIYSGNGLKIESLRISSDEQEILARGGVSKDNGDTLRLNVRNLDLDLIAPLLGKEDCIKGQANINAILSSPLGNGLTLLANASADSTIISGREAGQFRIGCAWDNEDKKMDFFLRNDHEGQRKLNAVGKYYPDEKILNAKTSLNRFNVGYAESFLGDTFSSLDGYISGDISVAGRIDRLSLFSQKGQLDDIYLKPAFTGVGYTLNGPFHLNDTELFLDDVTLSDSGQGRGKVSGGISFDHLKNPRLNARANISNLQILDNAKTASDSFYGNLRATGDILCSGPFNAVEINANVSTAGSGEVHIPLNGSAVNNSTNLLTFKDHSQKWFDPYEEMVKSMYGKNAGNPSDLTVKANARVTEGVEVKLEIDKESGNIISGRGSGDFSLELRPSKDLFSVEGDYTLMGGNYHFAALGIASKDFTIKNGSSIQFVGDIMDSNLDINGEYLAKASIGKLIADTTSVSNRRTVECGIHISDKLRNPKLAFSVDIPDLDPVTKSSVQSALNTEDKVQKQFLSLLLTNSFIPEEQSGIVNNSSLLLSNVTDIMSNQLSNILQKLDIPLDLGLNYQPNQGGSDIFDLAVSTQLFNNRVNVNGNIGNRQYNLVGNDDDLVGDIDIEIKLDRAGAVRLNLFSHSADQFTNYLDYSQRNGVGIAYQKEFNTLKDFFKNLFTKRKERQEMETKRRLEELGSAKHTIIITPDE